jgi:hypothetical protein
MTLLASQQDRVTKGLESDGGLPHILRHLDPFPDLILSLDQKVFGRDMRAHLLALEHAFDSIANPPNVATHPPLPDASHRFPLLWHGVNP